MYITLTFLYINETLNFITINFFIYNLCKNDNLIVLF